jgi:hypothetical protein
MNFQISIFEFSFKTENLCPFHRLFFDLFFGLVKPFQMSFVERTHRAQNSKGTSRMSKFDHNSTDPNGDKQPLVAPTQTPARGVVPVPEVYVPLTEAEILQYRKDMFSRMTFFLMKRLYFRREQPMRATANARGSCCLHRSSLQYCRPRLDVGVVGGECSGVNSVGPLLYFVVWIRVPQGAIHAQRVYFLALHCHCGRVWRDVWCSTGSAWSAWKLKRREIIRQLSLKSLPFEQSHRKPKPKTLS